MIQNFGNKILKIPIIMYKNIFRLTYHDFLSLFKSVTMIHLRDNHFEYYNQFNFTVINNILKA
jgi:hypothetical protein